MLNDLTDATYVDSPGKSTAESLTVDDWNVITTSLSTHRVSKLTRNENHQRGEMKTPYSKQLV